ncbi:ATP-binding protein [Pseudoclavibacter sp. 13-3]|nr:ATP-binding protein [Pseudoclavibacter sp. 13-3]
MADIIDNSIDAQADTVRIRFLVRGASLLGMQIRDNGTGMDKATLENALRLGSRREYSSSDMGHFGIGLKNASMGYAQTLTVYTTTVVEGEQLFAGLELSPREGDTDIQARSITPDRAEEGYRFGNDVYSFGSGTVVEWAGIKGASNSPVPAERKEWLNQTIESLRLGLGLVFHRLLSAGDLRIEMDVLDLATGGSGAPRSVDPLDPFGYKVPGRRGFPVQLSAAGPGSTEVRATCHILPPKGHDKLPGKKVDWQGLYIYRNNRLLTLKAGWHGLVAPKNDLKLARVEIELTDDLLPYASPTPEKNDVTLKPEYGNALMAAADAASGGDFVGYLDQAVSVWKDSNKRSTAKPITEIGSGLPSDVVNGLCDSFGWRANKEPVDIVWREIAEDDLFKVDLADRTLTINSLYSDVFGGEDTPSSFLFSTLLYLLTEANFTRESHLRTSTLDHLEQIDTALLAAIHASNDDAPSIDFKGMPQDALAALLTASRRQPPASPVQTTPAETSTSMRPGDSLPSEEVRTEDVTERASVAAETAPDALDPLEREVKHEASKTALVPPDVRRATHEKRKLPSAPLDRLDLEIFEKYCARDSITEIASALELTDNAVVKSLVLSVFGPEALEDDATLAPYHGMLYTPEERSRILLAYKTADDPYSAVPSVAKQVGRTPFAIAWKLLDSPKRPVPIDKHVRRSVRRRAAVLA